MMPSGVYTRTEEHSRNLSAAAKRRPPYPLVSKGTRQKQSEARKALWQDPEYVRKQMKANHVQPNQMELSAALWLTPLGFKYVGDGQLIIAGKCPDFWDGRTKVIELYGNYWHRNDDPQDRIGLFKAAGYDCLVIWEHELERLDLVQKRISDWAGDDHDRE